MRHDHNLRNIFTTLAVVVVLSFPLSVMFGMAATWITVPMGFVMGWFYNQIGNFIWLEDRHEDATLD